MSPGVRVPVLAAVVEHKDAHEIDQQAQHRHQQQPVRVDVRRIQQPLQRGSDRVKCFALMN